MPTETYRAAGDTLPRRRRKDNDRDNENLNTAQTAQTAQDTPQTAPEPPKKEKPKKEKMVKVLLPLLENGDTEQYVAVNGRSFLIRRGEEVEVPECVAEVLRLSEKQKREAYRYQQEAIRRSMQGGDM